MKLFGRQRKRGEVQRKRGEVQRTSEKKLDAEASMEKDVDELAALETPKTMIRATSEAGEAARESTREEITRIKLIEQGCCPECRSLIENFVFTQACLSCGWFRRMAPDSGRCIVHMQTGERIQCDRVVPVQGSQLLCVTDGVVRSQVMRRCVLRIEFAWDEQELDGIRKTHSRTLQGVCSWCEKNLQDAAAGGPLEEYVAFGAFQERYMLCSEKCLEAFRRQYSPRVHRNCYDTDCNACNQCIKRYDSRGFKRFVPVGKR